MTDPQRLRDIAKALRDQAGALEAEAATLDPPKAPAGATFTIKPGKGLQLPDRFLAQVKATLFPQLTDAQRDGCLAICAAGAGVLPLSWQAYALATAYHETAASMAPDQVENLNYAAEALLKLFPNRISQAQAQAYGRTADHPADQRQIANIIYGATWGAEHLGNIVAGDGWKYRGRSWPQLTGRANYAKADAALGLGGALLDDPSLIGRPDVAASVLTLGMKAGWFSGKGFKDYLASPASRDQFVNARRIINGTDQAEKVAGYAITFQGALINGGWL